MTSQSSSMITPLETSQAVARGDAVLVDVREEQEIAEGMAGPALWFPTSKMLDTDMSWKKFQSELPQDKTIIVYCRSGNRSGHVAAHLEAKGFKTRNMGGFSSWVGAGLPVKKPASR